MLLHGEHAGRGEFQSKGETVVGKEKRAERPLPGM